MADDEFTKGTGPQFAPRDNVVLEAGYFAGAKGRSQSLIIYEQGSKMPTDLSGILYLSLENRKRKSIYKLKETLDQYITGMLGGA